jgi:diguanylate cyclase (GGDEF)-like protein
MSLLHHTGRTKIIPVSAEGSGGPQGGENGPGGGMLEPVGDLERALPALTEVQQFWRQLRWLGPLLLVGALIVTRPRIPNLGTDGMMAAAVVLVLTPPLVNLLTRRETTVPMGQTPTRGQTVALVIDAFVILAVVALFCLAEPGSDAFALLFLPQLQMASTSRPPLMIATAVASCAAFLGIELLSAQLHGIGVSWSAIGARLTLLLIGAAVLGRIAVLFARHLSALRELHRDVAHRALHDPLTGLPNRALLFERIGVALARQERSGARFAVLFVDLDDLKTVNDTLGHAAGDELLRVTATRLHDELRTTDTPARLGGDEFAALLDDPGDDGDLESLGRRLLDRLGQPISADAQRLRASVSIGMATSEHISSAEELIRRADAAMYRAKAEGKGRIMHFNVDEPVDVREAGR